MPMNNRFITLVALLGTLWVSSFVGAFTLDERRIDPRHDLSTATPHEDSPSSPVMQSYGGSRPCKTQWGWDGSQWIRRDVVREIVVYKGVAYRDVLLKGPITLINTYDGDRCSVIGKKPTNRGLTIETDPLPRYWYKMKA